MKVSKLTKNVIIFSFAGCVIFNVLLFSFLHWRLGEDTKGLEPEIRNLLTENQDLRKKFDCFTLQKGSFIASGNSSLNGKSGIYSLEISKDKENSVMLFVWWRKRDNQPMEIEKILKDSLSGKIIEQNGKSSETTRLSDQSP